MRRYPSQIVGLPFVGRDGVICAAAIDLAGLAEGDIVELARDPGNPHDPSAVAVFAGGRHLGFVPARHGWIGEQLDAGRPIRASVDQVHRGPAGAVRNVDLHIDLARKGELLDPL